MERAGQVVIQGAMFLGNGGLRVAEKMSRDISGASFLGAVALISLLVADTNGLVRYKNNLNECRKIDPQLVVTLSPDQDYSHVRKELLAAQAEATGKKKNDLTCLILHEKERQDAMLWTALEVIGAAGLSAVSFTAGCASRVFRFLKLRLQ